MSHRTLMRDLEELRDAGHPINADRGRGGGVALQGRWGLERLMLSNLEVMSLLMALAITESLGSNFLTADLRGLRQRVGAALPDAQRILVRGLRKRILIGRPASHEVVVSLRSRPRSVEECILTGFVERRLMDIGYKDGRDAITRRKVELQFLVLAWPAWYLLAWDHLRRGVRAFRLDRIHAIELLDERFGYRSQDEMTAGLDENFFHP